MIALSLIDNLALTAGIDWAKKYAVVGLYELDEWYLMDYYLSYVDFLKIDSVYHDYCAD